MEFIKQFQLELVYGIIAVLGGVARYLNSYMLGHKFQLSMLIAGAFTAGFSGWMFAQIGTSMNMPQPITFMMAGVGGFFGEQSMKFLFEWITNRAK